MCSVSVLMKFEDVFLWILRDNFLNIICVCVGGVFNTQNISS